MRTIFCPPYATRSRGTAIRFDTARRQRDPSRSVARDCGRRVRHIREAITDRVQKAMLVVMFVVCGVVVGIGCGTRAQESMEPVRPLSLRPPGALEIRLEFSEQADLDLFVTDPDQETVYFGNSPSRGGGQLIDDTGCPSPLPRTEVVRFVAPRPGRYRVGIDYTRSCRFRRQPAWYRLEIRSDAFNLTHTGEVAPGRFEQKALEFTIEPHP